MITYEQREEAYNKATEIQQEMYAGPGAGFPIYDLSVKHQIDKNTEFAIAIGDVILGLVPQEKLPELLMERLQIEQPQAMAITADLLDFLAPLHSNNSATVVPIQTAADNSLQAEIAATERAMNTIQPMRTMSHDMEMARIDNEPVHTASSQADLLAPKPPLPQQQNRWGTEQV